MLSLSYHFCENWRERVGGEPDVDDVKRIINESVVLQRCRRYQRLDGRPYHTLAIYWHPVRGLIIKVDEFTGVVVTVLSGRNRRPDRFCFGEVIEIRPKMKGQL